ncbi:MAG TPA: hypothetical protein VNZ62_17475 [Capillimicrobium sp.]|nr:hypothetical protein [Capillimicrobium sp.]
MRRLACLAIAAAALGGCGSATVAELPPAAGPARAPAPTQAPAGRVVPVDAAPAPIAAALRAATTPRETTTGDGKLTAVVDARARTLELRDPATGRLVASAPAGVGPTHVAALGNRLYVTDTAGGALLIFHVSPDRELTLTRRVFLPGSPFGIAVDPQRGLLWVTLTARNELVGLTADHQARPLLRRPTVRRPVAVAVVSGTVAVAGRDDRVAQLLTEQETQPEDDG